MQRLRRHPVFFSLVALVLVAIAAEAWFVAVLRSQEAVLERDLNQKIAEIERLQRQRPGPTDENLRRARDDFAQNAEVLATMLRSLKVGGQVEDELFGGEPAGRTEAFFDLASFVASMQAGGTTAGVILRPDERFGFAAYANVPPEPELIQTVYRQRRVVEALLMALFEARPSTLVAVQREDPATMVQGKDTAAAQSATAPRPSGRASTFSGASAAAGEAVSEIFTIDPQVSARTPGYVDTMAFRIMFTGQTATLRGFMNALTGSRYPLIVRSVEVEPLRAEPNASAAARTNARAPASTRAATDQAIVADNESKFTVTIELFEVKLRAPEVTGSTP